MAKKNSMPDFTFALGADLREAAAKMREMSRPPKHDASVEEAVLHAPEDHQPTPDQAPEPPIVPDEAQETIASERSGETPFERPDAHGSDLSEPASETTDDTPAGEPEGPIAASETEVTASTPEDRENAPETAPETEKHPVVADAATPVGAPATESPAASAGPDIRQDGETAPAHAGTTEPPFPEREPECATVQMDGGQSLTVTNSHEQLSTVNDCYDTVSAQGAIDKQETVINSHQQALTVTEQSATVTQPSMTVRDDHRTPVPIFTVPERLTAVSGSPESKTVSDDRASTVIDSHFSMPEIKAPSARPAPFPFAEPPSPSAFPEPANELRTAAPSVQRQSSTVTMTVTDTIQPYGITDYSTESDQAAIAQSTRPHPEMSAKKPTAAVPPSIASATLQEAHLGGARQVLLNALTELRQQSPQVVVNLKRLAPAIGLSYGTVRNTISRLVREGVICTTQVRTGDAHGVCIEFLDDSPLPSLTAIAQPLRQTMTYHQPSLTVTGQSSQSQNMTPDDTCIWNTDADLVSVLWPHAANAGFGPAHLAQLRRAYQLQGWEPENVPRCLRYLDWELANGIAAGPEHVTAWLRVMQRQGHYPRPEGYVDPEVLRLRQQAEEERELAEARARFK